MSVGSMFCIVLLLVFFLGCFGMEVSEHGFIDAIGYTIGSIFRHILEIIVGLIFLVVFFAHQGIQGFKELFK